MTPSQDFLLQRFDYDSETGQFIKRCIQHNHDNTPGKKTKYGIQIRIIYNGELRTYLAHNLIWKYMTGNEPRKLGHYNKDKLDNRWENLFEITQDTNTLPIGIYLKVLKAPTGERNLGKLRIQNRNRWVVKLEGKTIGTFKCPTAAILARKKYYEN